MELVGVVGRGVVAGRSSRSNSVSIRTTGGGTGRRNYEQLVVVAAFLAAGLAVHSPPYCVFLS